MSRTTVSPAPLALFATLQRISLRLRRRAEDARMLQGLSRLDDHLLRDIGLGRHDLAAAGAALEPPARAVWNALHGRHYASPVDRLRQVSARRRR